MNFEKYVQNSNIFLRDLAQELGDPEDRARAGRVLRSVLRAFRNRLTHEESMHLLAQLPMCIKALYVDGWKLSRSPQKIKHVDEFIKEVMKQDARRAQKDFKNEEDAAEATRAVFRVIKRHVSDGEAQDIEAELPRQLKAFWEGA